MTALPGRLHRQPGQATLLVLAAVALGAVLAGGVASAVRIAVDRAHGQRVADVAALAGAAFLARHPLAHGQARVLAGAVARRGGDLRPVVTVAPDRVAVQVSLPALLVDVPGGRIATTVVVSASAVAAPTTTVTPRPASPETVTAAARFGLDGALLEAVLAVQDARGSAEPVAVLARRLAMALARSRGQVPAALRMVLPTRAAVHEALLRAGTRRPATAVLVR